MSAMKGNKAGAKGRAESLIPEEELDAFPLLKSGDEHFTRE